MRIHSFVYITDEENIFKFSDNIYTFIVNGNILRESFKACVTITYIKILYINNLSLFTRADGVVLNVMVYFEG